jgi:hypothetical protein
MPQMSLAQNRASRGKRRRGDARSTAQRLWRGSPLAMSLADLPRRISAYTGQGGVASPHPTNSTYQRSRIRIGRIVVGGRTAQMGSHYAARRVAAGYWGESYGPLAPALR